MSLDDIQREIVVWSDMNFSERSRDQSRLLLGVQEELGELCHHVLKRDSGIRGYKEMEGEQYNELLRDSIGDLCIFLMAFCERNNISLECAIRITWEEVRRRNWVAHPNNGTGPRDGE